MTITLATADAIDALALTIFDPHRELGSGDHATGLRAQDDATDAQYLALIAPVMLAIDGRTMAPNFKYTLNVTNALQGRPKHWYLRGIEELDSLSFWPASTALEYLVSPGVIKTGANSFGYTIGLATCACILHAWATIIRLWLAGLYPLALTQPA